MRACAHLFLDFLSLCGALAAARRAVARLYELDLDDEAVQRAVAKDEVAHAMLRGVLLLLGYAAGGAPLVREHERVLAQLRNLLLVPQRESEQAPLQADGGRQLHRRQ